MPALWGHRMKDRSRIHLQIEQQQGSSETAAFFALRLDSIGVCISREVHAKERLARHLDRQINLIASLPGLGLDSAVELRYLVAPQPESPHLGQVEVLLRVRVNGSSKESALERAEAAYRSFYPALVAMDEFYDWIPVTSGDEYICLFDTSDFGYVGELLRRQAAIQLGQIDSLLRHRPVGFLASTVRNEVESFTDSEVHVIAPFVPTFTGLDQLFDLLLLQPSTVVVSIVLTPTNLRPEELRYLSDQSARCERFLHDPNTSLGGSQPAPPLLAQASMILKQLNDSLFSLRDDCFCMSVRVAGKTSLSPILMEAVGNSVTGHVTANDGPTDGSQNSVMRGGYDWTLPLTEGEQATALVRLSQMDHAFDDDGLGGRLRYLFDARQANCAFRIPLPIASKYPGLDTRLARALPPPLMTCGNGLLIGENIYRGMRRPVLLLDEDRRRHTYILGQTGTGKSSLLRDMILQDIEANRGVAVLDPHGELIDDILPCIPRSRIDDVIYINPEEQDLAIGINMLEHHGELERDQVVNQLLEIFYRLYSGVPEALGPAFEQYFRNSALLEMADSTEAPMLDGILRIFSDAQYRKQRLDRCGDPLVRGFWQLAEKARGEASLEGYGLYVTNKLSRILYNTLLRRILLQPKSTIDFSSVLNDGKILLVDLCKGRLGDTNTAFLAMVITAMIQRAAFARTSVRDKNTLTDFHLYIDEFQNVATDSFITILSEARKYRLCATLTNQYLHQIPKEIADAINGNVGTVIAFRSGSVDAELLVDEFGTIIGREDFLNLPNFQAYVRTLGQGQAIAPFSIRTVPHEAMRDSQTVNDINAGKSRYGTPVSQVDAFVMERWAPRMPG